MNQEDFDYTIKDSLCYKFGDGAADRLEALWILSTKQDLNWKNLGITNVEKFKDYLKSVGYAHNTICNMCRKLRTAISAYYQLHDVSIKVLHALSIKEEASDKCVLTKSELDTLINYEYPEPGPYAILHQVRFYKQMMMVRDLFCISCLTGLRISDCMSITRDNIEYMNHRYYLVYKVQKTKKIVTVPAGKALLAIMDRGFYCQNINIQQNVYNKIIKEACKKAGLTARTRIINGGKAIIGPKWQFITSHTARRTFATLLYLNGIDIGKICMYMGHSSIATTQGYIRMFGVEDKKTRTFLDSFDVR